jgi:hypothetical protein
MHYHHFLSEKDFTKIPTMVRPISPFSRKDPLSIGDYLFAFLKVYWSVS